MFDYENENDTEQLVNERYQECQRLEKEIKQINQKIKNLNEEISKKHQTVQDLQKKITNTNKIQPNQHTQMKETNMITLEEQIHNLFIQIQTQCQSSLFDKYKNDHI